MDDLFIARDIGDIIISNSGIFQNVFEDYLEILEILCLLSRVHRELYIKTYARIKLKIPISLKEYTKYLLSTPKRVCLFRQNVEEFSDPTIAIKTVFSLLTDVIDFCWTEISSDPQKIKYSIQLSSTNISSPHITYDMGINMLIINMLQYTGEIYNSDCNFSSYIGAPTEMSTAKSQLLYNPCQLEIPLSHVSDYCIAMGILERPEENWSYDGLYNTDNNPQPIPTLVEEGTAVVHTFLDIMTFYSIISNRLMMSKYDADEIRNIVLDEFHCRLANLNDNSVYGFNICHKARYLAVNCQALSIPVLPSLLGLTSVSIQIEDITDISVHFNSIEENYLLLANKITNDCELAELSIERAILMLP